MDFRITEEHGHFDGLAWAADGALRHTGGDTIAADDLSSAVGDELDDLTELAAPEFGDTLVIILTPGYTPPTTAEEQDEIVGPVAFDPADPGPFFDALADKVLDACGRTLLGVRTARLRQRLTASAMAALPELAGENPFTSLAPVARLVFGTDSSYEFGTRWSFEAFAHHTDGSVTRDLDFANSCYQLLEDLSDLLDPYQGTSSSSTSPG